MYIYNMTYNFLVMLVIIEMYDMKYITSMTISSG